MNESVITSRYPPETLVLVCVCSGYCDNSCSRSAGACDSTSLCAG